MSCLVTHPPNSGSEGYKQVSTIQEAGARKQACVPGRFFSVYHEGVSMSAASENLSRRPFHAVDGHVDISMK